MDDICNRPTTYQTGDIHYFRDVIPLIAPSQSSRITHLMRLHTTSIFNQLMRICSPSLLVRLIKDSLNHSSKFERINCIRRNENLWSQKLPWRIFFLIKKKIFRHTSLLSAHGFSSSSNGWHIQNFRTYAYFQRPETFYCFITSRRIVVFGEQSPWPRALLWDPFTGFYGAIFSKQSYKNGTGDFLYTFEERKSLTIRPAAASRP